MTRAYIAVSSKAGEYAGTARIIKETVEKLRGVIKVDLIFGRFDLMVEVAVKDFEELVQLVEEIEGVENVTDTETFVSYSN